MKILSFPRKVWRGLPYLGKELRAVVSDRTPCFIAVPRIVHIWRNAPCNAKCIMCVHGYYQGENRRRITTSPFTDEMMPPALREIYDLCGRGTLVSYMGSEPTINRHAIEWIELAGRLGLDFRFTTNGYVIDEELARRYVAANMFNIGISLESLDPRINETIRPYPGGTAKTLRCIELLLQERERQKKHISINVKTVLTDINLESFLEIVKRFGKIEGLMCTPQVFEALDDLMPRETRQLLCIKDNHRLQRVTDQIRELKRAGYTINVTDQALTDIVRQNTEDRNHTSTLCQKQLTMDPADPVCNIGTDNMWIDNGLVKLCPYHAPIGSLLEEPRPSLKQMWKSEMARDVRARIHACRRLCTISCLRRTSLRHKISTFLKIA